MSHRLLVRLTALCLLILGSLCGSTLWGYYRSTEWLAQHIRLFQETSAAQGITFSTPEIRRTGWPWGASLSLATPQFHAHFQDHLMLGGAMTSIHLGGTWGAWLRAGLSHTFPPIHADGLSIIRVVNGDHVMTFHIHNMTLTHLSQQNNLSPLHMDFHGDTITLTTNDTPQSLHLTSLSGHLFFDLHAPPHDNQMALQLSADSLSFNGKTFPFNEIWHHAHMAAAFTRVFPLWMLSQPQSTVLHLHDFSIDMPSLSSSHVPSPPQGTPHMGISGTIALPDGNGLLSLHITHWRTGLSDALDLPIIQQNIAPDLRESLKEHLIFPAENQHPDAPPLTLSAPMVQWRISGLDPEKIRHFYQLLMSSYPTPND